jgi:hypothetical protein
MKRIIAFIISVSLLTNCTEEEITARNYPRVATEGITEVTGNSMKFNGNIFYASVEIIDHGFIWTDVGFPELKNGTKISLGAKSGPGEFETTITNATLQEGKVYSCRAYAQSAGYVVYGKIIEFKKP